MIGGGPAGMMAAGRAGELGAKVVLIEKKPKPGRKLLLTGNGRCNLTRAEFDLPRLVERYGKSGKFLFPSFNLFGPSEVMEFFESRGLGLKTELEGKVFPKTDRAGDVLDVLIRYLRRAGVQIRLGSRVDRIKTEAGVIRSIIATGNEIFAERYVIATGGLSYPQTGSDGRGFEFLKDLGHTITALGPALVPIKTREKWGAGLQGLSVKNIGLSAWQNKKKMASARGDIMFTHFGLSGPAALDLSGEVGTLLGSGDVKLEINLAPDSAFAELEEEISGVLQNSGGKMVKNCLSGLFPPRLAMAILEMGEVGPEKAANSIAKVELLKIVQTLKRLELTVSGLLGFDKAMVTSGGVSLKEIDPGRMRSKIISNLFLAGEIINLHGPSGGYNLQLCWSTGYLAGNSSVNS